jgi:hypothetical protein
MVCLIPTSRDLEWFRLMMKFASCFTMDKLKPIMGGEHFLCGQSFKRHPGLYQGVYLGSWIQTNES